MDTHGASESLYPFPDTVIIQDRQTAIQYGRTIFKQSVVHRCLVIWVDASVHSSRGRKRARLSTSAVRYVDLSSKRWKEAVTFNTLQYRTSVAAEAEFIAIHEAFRVASKMMDKFDRLVILSDCQSVLQHLKTGSRLSFLKKKETFSSLLAISNCMYDLRISVELRWVPAHSGVEGNVRVDELVTRFRRSGQSILAQEISPPILDNITVTTYSVESFRQALIEKKKTSIYDTGGNRKKLCIGTSVNSTKLVGQASPPP